MADLTPPTRRPGPFSLMLLYGWPVALWATLIVLTATMLSGDWTAQIWVHALFGGLTVLNATVVWAELTTAPGPRRVIDRVKTFAAYGWPAALWMAVITYQSVQGFPLSSTPTVHAVFAFITVVNAALVHHRRLGAAPSDDPDAPVRTLRRGLLRGLLIGLLIVIGAAGLIVGSCLAMVKYLVP